VDNHYRFEIPLKAAETLDFVVEEKRDVYESVQIANCGEEQIRFYLAQPYLSAGAKAFLKDVSDLMAQKSALQRQVSEWNQQVQRLTAEQDGLRRDIETFRVATPREQELRAKAVEALSANRIQLTELRNKLDDAGTKIRQLDETLAKKVREYKDE
jgi:chromosome segregation ATPase